MFLHSPLVHAPDGTSDDQVRCVIDAKRQWVLGKLRHPQKYQDRLHPPGKEVVNGESAPYLGRDYRIEIAETATGEIEFGHLFVVPPAHQAKRREVLRDWYIARAKETIFDRVEQNARSWISTRNEMYALGAELPMRHVRPSLAIGSKADRETSPSQFASTRPSLASLFEARYKAIKISTANSFVGFAPLSDPLPSVANW
jgi:hypothetical protein